MNASRRHTLTRTVPASEMIYPDRLHLQVKYYFWRGFTPYHNYCRDAVGYLGLMGNEGRQEFLLGTIAPHSSAEQLVSRLIEKGYGLHVVAWKDEGELASLRRVENFTHQHHVRIFEDGEVRGHYEYTPEAYPFLHLYEVRREERREEFFEHFGEHVAPKEKELLAGTSGGRAPFQWGFLPALKRLFS